jgi:hypothetical protein
VEQPSCYLKIQSRKTGFLSTILSVSCRSKGSTTDADDIGFVHRLMSGHEGSFVMFEQLACAGSEDRLPVTVLLSLFQTYANPDAYVYPGTVERENAIIISKNTLERSMSLTYVSSIQLIFTLGKAQFSVFCRRPTNARKVCSRVHPHDDELGQPRIQYVCCRRVGLTRFFPLCFR